MIIDTKAFNKGLAEYGHGHLGHSPMFPAVSSCVWERIICPVLPEKCEDGHQVVLVRPTITINNQSASRI